MIKQKIRNTDKSKVNPVILEVPLKLDINHPILGEENSNFIKQNIHLLKGSVGKAIVRTDTMEIVTTVSDDYKVITHKDMFDNVENTLKMSGLEFILYDINEGGKNRNRVYANYLLPSYKFDIDGDEWIPYIQAYSCYDKFLSYGLLTGLYRIKNESALLMFDRKLLASRRHLRGKLELTEDMVNVKNWIDKLGDLRRRINDLRVKPLILNIEYENVTVGDIITRYVIVVKKHRKKFEESKLLLKYKEQFGNNYYSLLIALMEYCTHVLYDEKKKRPYDRSRKALTQIADSFLGNTWTAGEIF